MKLSPNSTWNSRLIILCLQPIFQLYPSFLPFSSKFGNIHHPHSQDTVCFLLLHFCSCCIYPFPYPQNLCAPHFSPFDKSYSSFRSSSSLLSKLSVFTLSGGIILQGQVGGASQCAQETSQGLNAGMPTRWKPQEDFRDCWEKGYTPSHRGEKTEESVFLIKRKRRSPQIATSSQGNARVKSVNCNIRCTIQRREEKCIGVKKNFGNLTVEHLGP